MFRWTLIFLGVALLAGLLGFAGVTAMGLANVLFIAFLILFFVSLIFARRARS